MDGPLRHLRDDLAELERAGLLRTSTPAGPRTALVLCSNDYLGYAREPLPPSPVAGGAGGSRLISGDHAEHARAEAAIAAWLGAPAVLLFSSGYAANVGAVAALAGANDVIVSDVLNHASIIDGCRLSRARVVVVPHGDGAAVERALVAGAGARRRWVVTESYFSMEGDTPDLRELRRMCDAHDAALVVDEAHGLGVFGPSGRGLCAAAGVVPDVLIGTLGKAVGLQGAFVAGSAALREWLWNRARSHVFSTGMSPAVAHGVSERIARVAADDGGRERLSRLVARVRSRLAELGAPIARSHGPILPWLVGDNRRALELAGRLRDEELVVQPIRPPTVPPGGARLRITLHAALDDADLERALAALARLV
jgi:8-amino-7-oxononanoate synthase